MARIHSSFGDGASALIESDFSAQTVALWEAPIAALPMGVLTMRQVAGDYAVVALPLDLSTYIDIISLSTIPGDPRGFWYDDETGDTYVTSSDLKLYKRDSAGVVTTVHTFSSIPRRITAGGGRLYVACDNGRVYHLPIGGGTVVDFVAVNSGTGIKGMTYDEVNDWLFYIRSNVIYRRAFDGSAESTVFAPSTGVLPGIAVDPVTEKVFYTESASGSGFEDFWSVGYDGLGAAEFSPNVNYTATALLYRRDTDEFYFSRDTSDGAGVHRVLRTGGDTSLLSLTGFGHGGTYTLQFTTLDFFP